MRRLAEIKTYFLLIDVHSWQEGAQAHCPSIIPGCKETRIRGGKENSKNVLLFTFENPIVVIKCL